MEMSSRQRDGGADFHADGIQNVADGARLNPGDQLVDDFVCLVPAPLEKGLVRLGDSRPDPLIGRTVRLDISPNHTQHLPGGGELS